MNVIVNLSNNNLKDNSINVQAGINHANQESNYSFNIQNMVKNDEMQAKNLYEDVNQKKKQINFKHNVEGDQCE